MNNTKDKVEFGCGCLVTVKPMNTVFLACENHKNDNSRKLECLSIAKAITHQIVSMGVLKAAIRNVIKSIDNWKNVQPINYQVQQDVELLRNLLDELN